MSEPHRHTPGCGHNTVALYCDHCGELTHWPDPCPVQVAVAAERERWRAALKDATEGLEEMLPYVPEYFRDKWDLPAYIARARATLAQMGDGDGR